MLCFHLFTIVQLYLPVKTRCHKEEYLHIRESSLEETTNARGEMSAPGGEIGLYRATELSGGYDYEDVE